jgi:predicted RNase H-like HicB family nuclease
MTYKERRSTMKRQEHLTEVEEAAIRVRVESLNNGGYLATSPDVPGLVAEGRSISETVEIAQGVARKMVETCREHGDALTPAFRNKRRATREFRIRVSVS